MSYGRKNNSEPYQFICKLSYLELLEITISNWDLSMFELEDINQRNVLLRRAFHEENV